MRKWLWPMALIAAFAGAATAFVYVVFWHEAGRRRVLPVLRPLLKHMFNPPVLRAAARGETPYAIVNHIGRRSGAAYRTPVDAQRTPEGVLITLPYGPITDWCRNVLASGRCTLVLDREELTLAEPQILPASLAERQVSAVVARRWHRQGIAHYLSLKRVPRVEPEAVSVAAASA